MYDKVCRSCHTKLSEFYKTGYLGCPDCYREFSGEMVSVLSDMQGGTSHTGKKPKLNSVDRELLSDYQRYLKEKENAGLEGRFSDMAKLNKIISELSEELKRRGLI